MLQQSLKEKWSLLQLPVSFRIDFLRFYFHGSAGYVPWLYYYPWSPVQARVQFELLRLGSFGCYKVLIEKNTFRFSIGNYGLHMWGGLKKGLVILTSVHWSTDTSIGSSQDGPTDALLRQGFRWTQEQTQSREEWIKVNILFSKMCRAGEDRWSLVWSGSRPIWVGEVWFREAWLKIHNVELLANTQ